MHFAKYLYGPQCAPMNTSLVDDGLVDCCCFILPWLVAWQNFISVEQLEDLLYVIRNGQLQPNWVCVKPLNSGQPVTQVHDIIIHSSLLYIYFQSLVSLCLFNDFALFLGEARTFTPISVTKFRRYQRK
jgi:hypothetical protein